MPAQEKKRFYITLCNQGTLLLHLIELYQFTQPHRQHIPVSISVLDILLFRRYSVCCRVELDCLDDAVQDIN